MIERDFIGYILNNPNFLDELQIKPKYLKDEICKYILTTIIEYYNKHKCLIIPDLINTKYGNEIIDIFVQTLYFQNNADRTFREMERQILIDFKKRFIKHLNEELENEKISYDDFTDKINQVSKINITNTNSNAVLSISDIDCYKRETLEFIKTNCSLLDEKIRGFALTQLSVWSGSNASAKSTYLNQIALESIEQGYKVAIYSGELTAPRLMNWIIMQCCGKQNMTYNRQGDYYYVDNHEKAEILQWLNNKLFIYNNDFGNRAGLVIDELRRCIKQNDIKVLIIDNLMSMNLSKYGDNKFDAQSGLIQDLSALAKELNIHIHFVCHPRKSTTFLRKEDISGSADLSNYADNIFIMHRVNNDFKIRTKDMFKWSDDSDIYKYTNVIEICKNREFGCQDVFLGLYFEPESKRMKNYPEEIKDYGWKKQYSQGEMSL